MGIFDNIKNWVLSIGAGLVGMIGVYLYGRNSGSLREMQKQAEADREKARKIEDAADRARRVDGDNVDATERLRKYKRLRDL